ECTPALCGQRGQSQAQCWALRNADSGGQAVIVECLAGRVQRHGPGRDLWAEAGNRDVLVSRMRQVRMDLIADDEQVAVERQRRKPSQLSARETATRRIVRVAQDHEPRT